MHGLLSKNIYDLYDCYRMQDGDFLKTATYTRHDVLSKMAKGAVFYAFSKETTQYARLIPSYDKASKSFYMRTDKRKLPANSFFLDMDAPRLVPYEKKGLNVWAVGRAQAHQGNAASNPDLFSEPTP